jgi:hypothetical protein
MSNVQRPTLNSEVGCPHVGLLTLNYLSRRSSAKADHPSTASGRRLHKLDGCPIGVANVDDARTCIRTRFKSLRSTGSFPTGRGNRVQHSVEIIDRQRHMDRPDIAGSEIGALSVGRGVVLQQFNLVSRRLQNCERDFSTGHASDFTGELAGMMRAMRKLEAENSLPESERSVEVCDCDTGVVGGNDAKWDGTHILIV